jgi:hypothetical protein
MSIYFRCNQDPHVEVLLFVVLRRLCHSCDNFSDPEVIIDSQRSSCKRHLLSTFHRSFKHELAMKKNLLTAFLGLVFMNFEAYSQTGEHVTKYIDATFGVAKYQGTLSLSYVHTWRLGAKQKLGIGLGARFTSYLAANQYYTTAPATLTSGSTSPTIIFQDNIQSNIDSFLIKSPQVNSVNLSINIDYRLSKTITAGFNIDAIGFSFGGSRTGNYINGASGKILSATPTPFNILLISDNDKGSLNSEFYFKYLLNDKWGLKVGAQFLFTEYTTETKVQQFPEPNDRFRNKSLLFCVGASFRI